MDPQALALCVGGMAALHKVHHQDLTSLDLFVSLPLMSPNNDFGLAPCLNRLIKDYREKTLAQLCLRRRSSVGG